MLALVLTVVLTVEARLINAAEDESSKSLVNCSPTDRNVTCRIVSASAGVTLVVGATVVVTLTGMSIADQ